MLDSDFWNIRAEDLAVFDVLPKDFCDYNLLLLYRFIMAMNIMIRIEFYFLTQTYG